MTKVIVSFVSIILLIAANNIHLEAYTGMSIHFANGVNNPSSGLIEIKLGKKKEGHTHCSSIFAICPDQSLINPPNCNYIGMELCIKIIHDGTNPLPFELHLIDDPELVGEPVENFIIYEDILIPVSYMPFNTAKIPAGTYHYNSLLGIYGGYSIPVIGID